MARVETVVPTTRAAEHPLITVRLKPSEIIRTPRPEPFPENEPKLIEALAQSFRENGQIVPIVVKESDSGGYVAVDGNRRIAAACLIDGFYLNCVVNFEGDPVKIAIHANIKRRGYTPLQFAHLCAEIRKTHSWSGTKEVADYLGVSRAQVSQHDKLLSKPEGMTAAVYKDLLAKVGSGRIGAETAFYTLTHVEPTKAAEVMPRAQAIADRDQDKRTPRTSSKGSKTAPMSSNARETAKETKPPTSKPALIKTRHVQQAAREAKAIKSDIQKTLPELRKLFDVLHSTAYPDVMRNFVSLIADAWWRGDATDKQVVTHWGQIAMLVDKARANGEASESRA